jgi:CTP:molybdopterin cytidylyltransferase MocA
MQLRRPYSFQTGLTVYPYMTIASIQQFTAVVLAADRTPNDPVALAAKVSCKALAPVGGRPMVLRVLDALAGSKQVNTCILCGPPAAIVDREPLLQERLAAPGLRWLPPHATPSTSAAAALATIPAGTPVLLTTADHALLRPEMVEHFCREAQTADCDVVAALASYTRIAAKYPGMRRTRTRFSDGDFCGCNLFAFLTPQGRAAADFWRRVENERKRPVKMLSELGWRVVLRYLLGRLSLKDALQHISRRMGLRAGVVILPFPEAAVDVDSVSDWAVAQRTASGSEC